MNHPSRYHPSFSVILSVFVAFVTIAIVFDFNVELAAASNYEPERRHHELVEKARTILDSRGDWSEARRLLEQARSLFHSKEADFYYGWLLCQSSSERDTGRKLLSLAQKNHIWSKEKLSVVKAQQEKCGTDTVTRVSSVKENFVIAAIQKGGNWSTPMQLESLNVLPAVPWQQVAQSATALKKVFPTYNTVTSKPFLVTGPFSHSYLSQLSDRVLNPYFNFLKTKLGVEYVDTPIYVFVAGNHDQFSTITRRLYTITQQDKYIPDVAIAFSDPGNNTMMAICGAKASNCTSFAHELFHILNAKVFEDAPWWLYEGAAEFFESGDLQDGDFHARVGWRKHSVIIDDLDANSFHTLLTISKNDPTLNNPPGNEVAMSRVRFFCRYLNEKNVLWPIYSELKGREIREAGDDPAGITVIEKHLKKPFSEVRNDFKQWFKRVVLPERALKGP